MDYEVVVPDGPRSLDEVEQVLKVIEDRPEVTLLVVGVRKRSPIGKVVLGSIPQRLVSGQSAAPVRPVASRALGRVDGLRRRRAIPPSDRDMLALGKTALGPELSMTP